MNLTVQVVTIGSDIDQTTYQSNGETKTKVSFAGYVRKSFKKDDEKDNHFNYVAFGGTADHIAKYFKKGSKALITSEINNNHYKNKDGVYIPSEQFVIQKVEFYGSKADGEVQANNNQTSTPKATNNTSNSSNTTSTDDEDYLDF